MWWGVLWLGIMGALAVGFVYVNRSRRSSQSGKDRRK